MAVRLLLVHSPLTGCGVWNLVAAELGGAGYEPEIPDLTGAVGLGPPYCVRLAGRIGRSLLGAPVILIGHSRAGLLLATAAAMTGQGVQGCIFVDARLPKPGQA